MVKSSTDKHFKIIDALTAVFLSVAAVGTAWTSYEASNWGSKMLDSLSKASTFRADASRNAAEASSQISVDSIMWVSWAQAVKQNREDEAQWLRERFSPALDKAQERWQGNVSVADENDPDFVPENGTPLDLDSYVPPGQALAAESAARGEEKLADAEKADGISTQYVLLAVMFALVLFFASIATKFSSLRIQAAMTFVAFLVLASTTVRLLMLPLA